MVLTVPDIAIIDGPGYRRSYGETTKRAAEGSVFSLPTLPQGQMGLGVTRSELANLDVVGGWIRMLDPTTVNSFYAVVLYRQG